MKERVRSRIPASFKQAISIAALLAAAIVWMQTPALLSAQAAFPSASPPVKADEFVTLYPGVYTLREKPLVEKYIADNQAIADRGPIDLQALIHGTLPKDTPGVGGVLHVTEEMVRYENRMYDPDNRLLSDAAYARLLGYKNIPAYPTFSACDDLVIGPYPPEARDTLLVSQLNHDIQIYRPVYPGDTLYTVVDSRNFYDITPPQGSIYRSLVIINNASIYNQNGEKVNGATFRVLEAVKIYKPGLAIKNPAVNDIMERPSWTARPEHHYTDKDWAYIKSLWVKEKQQGATPLYWEDVKVGDEPAWTVDGPIMQSVIPGKPYGMGTGGSRTMRHEIMDPQIFKTMIHDPATGIYLMPNKVDYIPAAPGVKEEAPTVAQPAGAIDTRDLHRQQGEARAVLVNYFGRDLAIRNIDNWMGDHGAITDIRWGIMEPETLGNFGKIVQRSPFSDDFLAHVPYMKGKHVMAHGLTHDVAIVKSYVYKKYIEDGNHYVEVAWWVTSIDGYIWEAGGATVKLPSKNAK